MLNIRTQISNLYGEALDVLITGVRPEKAKAINVYVHGFGTDKNEGFASFMDLSNAFDKQFINIRFDQSGYGQSQGKDYMFSLLKASSDLKTILVYAKDKYPGLKINVIAHSLGMFVTLLAMPTCINKVIFTAIVNANAKFISDFLANRIKQKGGKIDKNGISIYKRSSGAIQLIGSDFWETLENFQPIKYLKYLASCTKVYLFKPLQDDVLPNKYFEDYKSLAIENKNIFYYEINGNHNYTNRQDRISLVKEMKEILN